MNQALGASAFAETGSCASTMPASGHGPTGCDPARSVFHTMLKCNLPDADEWRPALAAFYHNDGMYQAARNVRYGAPLDYLDQRRIIALKAARAVMP